MTMFIDTFAQCKLVSIINSERQSVIFRLLKHMHVKFYIAKYTLITYCFPLNRFIKAYVFIVVNIILNKNI
jgi:hypothetical protein